MVIRWIVLGAIICYGSGPVSAQVHPCPPAGLTADSSAGEASNCTNDEADWAARSSGSAVFYRNNFDYADTTAMKADNWHSSGNGNNVPASDHLHLDTIRKLSGTGCMRANVTGRSANQGNFRFSWTGNNSTKNITKSRFYFQYAIYTDARLVTTYLDTGSGSRANKLSILQEPDQSFGTGEIVITNRFFNGYINGYTIGSAVVHFFDNPPAHGAQWVPDGWTVLETLQDTSTGEFKMWAAEYGNAPTLLIDTTYSLGAAGNYTGGQLTNYDTQGWLIVPAGTGDRSFNGQAFHTFHCWDEVIASDNWIPFPQNLSGGEL